MASTEVTPYDVVVVDSEPYDLELPDGGDGAPSWQLRRATERSARKVMRRAAKLAVVVVRIDSKLDAAVDILTYLRDGLRDRHVRVIALAADPELGEHLVQLGLSNVCLRSQGISAGEVLTQLRAELRTFAQMERAEAKRTAQLELLTTLAGFSKSEVDLEGCLEALTEAIRAVAGAQVCHVIAVDDGGALCGTSHAAGSSSIDAALLERWAVAPGTGSSAVRRAVVEQVTQICIEREESEHTRATTFFACGVHGSVAVPVVCDGDTIAVIQCLLHENDMQDVSVELVRIIEKATEQFGVLLDRRQAEERLAYQYERLRSTLDELKHTQAQLVHSEKMASIGQMAAGIAHEINNPIAFIKSNFATFDEYLESMLKLLTMHQAFLQSIDQADRERCRTLRHELGAYSEEVDLDFLLDDIRSLVVESQEGVHRVAEIVADLRSFSRADNDAADVVDVHEALASTLNVARPKLKPNVEVVREFGELPSIRGHLGQLNQVFMNLVVNAVDAMDGSGSLFIATRHEGQEIIVSIRDTGSGIDSDTQKRIFDPFFTTKPVGAGTGLGLSISYGIIQRHGGRIECHSIVGEGTEMRVVLPLEHEPVASAA